MRFGHARDPPQDKIHGWNRLDLYRVRVKRILAGRQRLFPNAAFVGANLFSVPESGACRILPRLAVVAHHHSYRTDWDQILRLHFD